MANCRLATQGGSAMKIRAGLAEAGQSTVMSERPLGMRLVAPS